MKFSWVASSGVSVVLLMASVYGTDYVVDLDTDASVNTGGAGSATSGDFRYVLNQILNEQAQESSPSTNTVTFTVPHVTLSAPPPLINLFNADTITIGNTSGSPTIIDGNNLYRPFFIVQGTATLQNLTIQNGLAQGGNGGTGGAPSGNTGSGGAGAGLGGALFIDSAAVTINNVNFVNNGASAGRGGIGIITGTNGGGGGGGGMGGNGGNGSGAAGAGGGGGVVGNGGSSNSAIGSTSWGGGGGGAGGNGGAGDNATLGGGGSAIIGANGGDGSTNATGNNGGTVGSYVFGGGGGSGGAAGGIGGGFLPGSSGTSFGGGGGYNAAALSPPTYGGIGGGGGNGGGGQATGGLGGGGGAGDVNSSQYGGGAGAGYTGGNGGAGGGGAVTTAIAGGSSGSGGFGGGGAGGTAQWPAGDGSAGNGGFGGGGGSGFQTGGNGTGGPAGSNATATSGGDGGACGGAIFVNAAYNYTPASLTIQGNCTFSNSSVSANSGLGAAVGTDIFIYSSNGPYPSPTIAPVVFFAPGTGNTVTLTGNIADDSTTSITGSGTWVAGQGSGSSLQMQGPGTLVLQGTNTYVGGTIVQGGRLSVNGSILGGITVNAQGTIGGTGTIYGGGNISGTLSPGNSIGTITLDTTTTGVSLLCKAVTNIEINPTESSLVLITGTNGITLNDTTVNVTADAGDYGTSGTYPILDGVYVGSYDPKVTGGLSGYLYSLSYGSNVIYLDYQIIPISLEGLTHNPKRVANYLMENSAQGTSLVNSLSGIPLENALNSISPSRNAFGNYIASQVMFSLSNLLGGHVDAFRSAETSFSAKLISAADLLVSSSDNKFLFWKKPKKKSSVKAKKKDSPFHGWVSEFGEVGHQAASTDDPAFTMYTGAVLAGFDYDFKRRGLVGGSIGYAYTRFLDDDHRGSGKINYYFGNVYGNAAIGDLYLSPAVWVVFDQIKNKRNISFPGYSSHAKANIYAWQCIPHLEVGYNIRHSLTTITPFTQLDWAVTWQSSYKEHGGGYFNAKVGRRDTSILRSETGMKRSDEWGFNWGMFFLKEKLSYVYETPFGTGALPTSFVGSPGSFTVTAASINQALNLADISIKFGAAVGKIRPTLLELDCEGQVGPSYWSSQAMFTVKW